MPIQSFLTSKFIYRLKLNQVEMKGPIIICDCDPKHFCILKGCKSHKRSRVSDYYHLCVKKVIERRNTRTKSKKNRSLEKIQSNKLKDQDAQNAFKITLHGKLENAEESEDFEKEWDSLTRSINKTVEEFWKLERLRISRLHHGQKK